MRDMSLEEDNMPNLIVVDAGDLFNGGRQYKIFRKYSGHMTSITIADIPCRMEHSGMIDYNWMRILVKIRIKIKVFLVIEPL